MLNNLLTEWIKMHAIESEKNRIFRENLDLQLFQIPHIYVRNIHKDIVVNLLSEEIINDPDFKWLDNVKSEMIVILPISNELLVEINKTYQNGNNALSEEQGYLNDLTEYIEKVITRLRYKTTSVESGDRFCKFNREIVKDYQLLSIDKSSEIGDGRRVGVIRIITQMPF